MNQAKRQRIRTIKLYFADFLLLAAVWGGFYRCRLANSDTLWGEIRPDYALDSQVINFRWLGLAGDAFSYHVLHYYPYEHQTLSLLLFLLVLALCLLLLEEIFRPLFEQEKRWARAGAVAACALAFVNVLFADYYYFTESFLTFKLGLLATMLGALLLSRRHYVAGAVLLAASVMFYQVFCVTAAIVLVTHCFLEEKGRFSGRLVRRELAAILIPMGAGLLNYATGPLILRIINERTGKNYETAKIVSDEPLCELIKGLIRPFRSLYESSLGLMAPVWLPLVFSTLVTVVILAVLVRRRCWNETLTYLLYKAVVFVLMSVLQVMSFNSEFTARVIEPFYVMQAMNAVAGIGMISLRNGVSGACGKEDPVRIGSVGMFSARQPGRMLVTGICGYLLAQVFFVQIIIANRCVSENLDMLYANAVLDRVDAYEEETGTQVTGAVFCNDTNAAPYYPQVHFTCDAINMRLYGTASYSLVETAAREKGRHLELADTKENAKISEELFGGKDWSSFDPDEQVVIRDHTLYVCVF